MRSLVSMWVSSASFSGLFYCLLWMQKLRSNATTVAQQCQPYHLTRAQLAEILGVDLVDVSLHAAVYGDADPPR
ncbi:MAG: hypothetical protein P8176_03370, partial [Gammaproteobacteria bacterium]